LLDWSSHALGRGSYLLIESALGRLGVDGPPKGDEGPLSGAEGDWLAHAAAREHCTEL